MNSCFITNENHFNVNCYESFFFLAPEKEESDMRLADIPAFDETIQFRLIVKINIDHLSSDWITVYTNNFINSTINCTDTISSTNTINPNNTINSPIIPITLAFNQTISPYQLTCTPQRVSKVVLDASQDRVVLLWSPPPPVCGRDSDLTYSVLAAKDDDDGVRSAKTMTDDDTKESRFLTGALRCHCPADASPAPIYSDISATTNCHQTDEHETKQRQRCLCSYAISRKVALTKTRIQVRINEGSTRFPTRPLTIDLRPIIDVLHTPEVHIFSALRRVITYNETLNQFTWRNATPNQVSRSDNEGAARRRTVLSTIHCREKKERSVSHCQMMEGVHTSSPVMGEHTVSRMIQEMMPRVTFATEKTGAGIHVYNIV